MKLKDLYLIDKEKWLDVIKDMCKKKAKTNFWVWLVSLILMIMVAIAIINIEHSTPYSTHDIEGFVYPLTLFLFALTSGWWVLKSHSFLKTIDGLDTPEQLLNKFKKYVKDKSIIWTIGDLILLGYFAYSYYTFTSDLSIIVKVIIWIIFLAAATASIYRLIRGKYLVASSDEDITRRLQELIGEE